MVSTPKPKSVKARDFSSHYMDATRVGELNKSQTKLNKKGEFVFEKIKNFTRYFPHNNAEVIIKNINKKNKLKMPSPRKNQKMRQCVSVNEVETPSSGKKQARFLASLPNLFKKDKFS